MLFYAKSTDAYIVAAMDRTGELAAFGTAVLWTVSALCFEKASKRLGALAVNFHKVLVAFVLLSLASLALRGRPFPTDAPPSAWLWLSVSGFVGFVIADYFLFNAYIMVGSRRTIVFQALTPLFAAALGFVLLGDRMETGGLAGMVFVLAGIILVVTSPSRNTAEGPVSGRDRPSVFARGYVFAFLAALFQAAGLVLSRRGLAGYDAIPGTQIRILTAIAGFTIQAFVHRRQAAVFTDPLRDRTGMAFTLAGAVFGPFLGVTLSLVAVKHTDAGTASTLMGLTPVLIIAPSVILLKQRVQGREIAGAVLAVTGAALFFLL